MSNFFHWDISPNGRAHETAVTLSNGSEHLKFLKFTPPLLSKGKFNVSEIVVMRLRRIGRKVRVLGLFCRSSHVDFLDGLSGSENWTEARSVMVGKKYFIGQLCWSSSACRARLLLLEPLYYITYVQQIYACNWLWHLLRVLLMCDTPNAWVDFIIYSACSVTQRSSCQFSAVIKSSDSVLIEILLLNIPIMDGIVKAVSLLLELVTLHFNTDDISWLIPAN